MNSYKNKYRKVYEGTPLSIQEIDSEIDFVIEMLTDYKLQDFILGKNISIQQDVDIVNVLNTRVQTGKPLQQIIGKAFFAGNKYFVNDQTLIPRPETEILVEQASLKFDKNSKIKILDIGTGSGCIAIELAKLYPNSKIIASDISEKTLMVAMKNAEIHKVEKQIDFVCSDIFSNIKDSFDIIVSNPPYISYEDVEEVQKDVYEYEPHRALFAEEKGFYFYREIIENSKKYLNENSYILFEIGYKQADVVTDFLIKNSFANICLTQDFDDKNRVISAQKF